MNLAAYIDSLNKLYRTGQAREHAYRPALQSLLETYCKGITVINEPARVSCGAPDLILNRGDIPVGYMEAKDIGVSLEEKAHKDQFTRYKASLDNLVFTDYLDFHFYRDGVATTSIRIGELRGGSIVPLPERFDAFESLLYDFAQHESQSIKSSKKLAELMAGKARLLADVIESAVDSDVASKDNTELQQQMKAFKDVLIHDITPREFADLYAQTIAYGMFAARLHDTTLETFTRQEAAALIPKSNPFLRKLFQNVAGYDLDTRIAWIVDLLADVFRAADVAAILKNFGRSTRQEDPMIHFYETFLAAYDPALRKARGVWYTPEPVVKFIVRAVDDLLKSEFGLSAGLADTSKTKIEVSTQSADARFKERVKRTEIEVHKVQILDPATGTGTFLAEVVRYIHARFEGQQGVWSRYVEEHLLPRVNGFELLMASYAMAHLKLDLLLTETGYKPRKAADAPRLRVYLTNSLEEHHRDSTNLFWAQWLSEEAREANRIKRDTPVMVVLGNPPYLGESKNKDPWILGLMKDYKKEPGGNEKLKEKNSKWLNNDYVKFIRLSQHFIEKNGEGVLAFINPHGFHSDPTFRGMRWNLLKSFDKIYLLDLHGNTKNGETASGEDQNVFDIEPGVSVNIFIKTKNGKKALGEVYRFDLSGKRQFKYNFLNDNSIKSVGYKKITPVAPHFFFTGKDYNDRIADNDGFNINSLFNIGNSGVVTKRDTLNIHYSKEQVAVMIRDIIELSESECRTKYAIPDDVRDWNFNLAKRDILTSKSSRALITEINYRPFDKRFFYYSGRSKGVVGWPVPIVSEHLKQNDNFGLMLNKKIEKGEFAHALIYRGIVESHALSMKEINYVFPLYLYQQDLHTTAPRTPNLNEKLVAQIAAGIGLNFVPEKSSPSVHTP